MCGYLWAVMQARVVCRLPDVCFVNSGQAQYTPLWIASSRGHADVVCSLVEVGASLDTPETVCGEGATQPCACVLCMRQGGLGIVDLVVVQS
jgi:hypothetical protein